MRFRPPLQAVNSISQKGSLVWSGFMFVHDGKTTLTLFRDLRLFWSTFNKNMCIRDFSVLFFLHQYLTKTSKKQILRRFFSFFISGFFGQHSTRTCVLVHFSVLFTLILILGVSHVIIFFSLGFCCSSRATTKVQRKRCSLLKSQ